MDLKYLTAPITKASAGGFDAVITTPRVDRDGESVDPRGLINRDEYLANPLVYWAHEWARNPSAEPIGKATSLDVRADRISSSAEYAPTTKAQNIRALVLGKFVRRTSIGFDPIDMETIRGIPTHTKWSLREYSVVPMPANTDATITGVKSALHWLADEVVEPTADVGPDALAARLDPTALLSSVGTLKLAFRDGALRLMDGGRVIATIRRRRSTNPHERSVGITNGDFLVDTDEPVVDLPDDATLDKLADALAKRQAATTPQRSILGDVPQGGVVQKAGDGPAYGGDDKYSAIGETDADVATNLYIVKTVLEGSKAGHRLSGRGRDVMVKAADRALRTGLPTLNTKGWNPSTAATLKADMAAYRAEARTKAMTSTGANAGDEWVPTFASSTLWNDIHLATTISAQLQRVQMPTNPFDLPTLTGSATFYLAGTENVAVSGSTPATDKATLTAKKVQADVDFSGETSEDSIIAITPTIRADLVRKGAQCIDDLIVHGDTETGSSGNVNTDDGAPAANSFYLAFDGLRKFCLVTNTDQVKAFAGAPTTTLFLNTRGLMGKYGARPSELLFITGVSTTNAWQDVTEWKTLDVYGPQATVLSGEVARIFNIPVLLSEAIPGQTTDKVDDDGLYTTTSPSTNDTDGWFVLVNKLQWTQGFRRDFQLESDRNIKTDTNTLVASFRMALIPSGISTLHTAVGRDITVL